MVQQLSGTTGDTTYETPGIPSWINGLAGGVSYTLPVASASVLGGVKQGSGVTIAGDGTIAATGTSGVGTFNTRSGTVVLLTADVTGVLGSGLPVANGGTGATSATAARTALGLGTAATLASSAVVQTANNLSDVTAATARTNLGIATVGNTGAYTDLTARPPGSATLSFGMGAVVVAGTVYVDVPYAATITTLKYNVGTAGGSFTVAVQIAGVNVTSLSAVAVSSSSDNTATATGANTVTAGQRVGIVFSSVTGSPTDAVLTLTWTH